MTKPASSGCRAAPSPRRQVHTARPATRYSISSTISAIPEDTRQARLRREADFHDLVRTVGWRTASAIFQFGHTDPQRLRYFFQRPHFFPHFSVATISRFSPSPERPLRVIRCPMAMSAPKPSAIM